MIRDALELCAIGAFIAMIAVWSGIGTGAIAHTPTCKAGSVSALLTNCEVEQ